MLLNQGARRLGRGCARVPAPATARCHAAAALSSTTAAAPSSGETRYEALKQRLLALETTVVCDADKANQAAHPTGLATLQVLDPAIYPLQSSGDLKMVGIARTVSARQEEFLTVLHALAEAQPGEVLMIDAGGAKRAKCGEIFATAALQQGLAGIVVDGAARDSALIRELPLPYFVRSITPVAGSTSDAYGETQVTVTVGGCTVSPGDVVFGDADGVLIGTLEAFEAIVETAEIVADVEDKLMRALTDGGGSRIAKDLTQLSNVAEHVEKVRRGEKSFLQFHGFD